MVFYCSAINCYNTNSLKNRAKKITFHRFPRDRVKRTAWALATRRQGHEKGTLWKPSKYSVLCSNHFLETDFTVGTKLRILKPGVIPTVFDFPDCNIKTKVIVIQQSQEKTTVPGKNERTLPPPSINVQEHSYIKQLNKVSNVKSKVPVIKRGQKKASKNGNFTRKETLPSPKKKTVTLPSFNIQENSNVIEYDEVSNIKAIKVPVILLSQKEASKYKGTLPSQKKKTAPLPPFNIQEHSNTIECDKVSDIKAKVPVIQKSQKKVSKTVRTLLSEKEKTVPLCSIIIPTSSNVQEHSNLIESDEVINLKRKLEAAESKFENTYKKLCATKEVVSRKERRIQELLNSLKEQKELYESVKDRAPAYTDRSTDLQIELITRKPGIPYSEEMKTFAKTLRGFSPKAYDFLRDTLNLPSDRTLRQKKDNIDDKCTEFHTQTFQVLAEKSPNYDTGNNYCRLMFDGKIISGNRKICF